MNKDKVTIDDVEAAVRAEQYHVFPGTTLTTCCLTLDNGYTVTGESACVDPANFNVKLGQELARSKAIDKVWGVLGFRLADSRMLTNTLHPNAGLEPPRVP